MKVIKLTRGHFAKVDDSDYERIVNFGRWTASFQRGRWYAYSNAIKGVRKASYMHNVVTGNKGIDHKDGDGLNNQKNNLRVATQSQNSMNCKLSRSNSTGYKGVYRNGKRFIAQVSINGKVTHLGRFNTVAEAGLVATEARRKLYGEFFRDLTPFTSLL